MLNTNAQTLVAGYTFRNECNIYTSPIPCKDVQKYILFLLPEYILKKKNPNNNKKSLTL